MDKRVVGICRKPGCPTDASHRCPFCKKVLCDRHKLTKLTTSCWGCLNKEALLYIQAYKKLRQRFPHAKAVHLLKQGHIVCSQLKEEINRAWKASKVVQRRT